MKRVVQSVYEDNAAPVRESVIALNRRPPDSIVVAIEISDSDDSTMNEPVTEKARAKHFGSVEQQTNDEFSGNIPFELAPVISHI